MKGVMKKPKVCKKVNGIERWEGYTEWTWKCTCGAEEGFSTKQVAQWDWNAHKQYNREAIAKWEKDQEVAS